MIHYKRESWIQFATLLMNNKWYILCMFFPNEMNAAIQICTGFFFLIFMEVETILTIGLFWWSSFPSEVFCKINYRNQAYVNIFERALKITFFKRFFFLLFFPPNISEVTIWEEAITLTSFMSLGRWPNILQLSFPCCITLQNQFTVSSPLLFCIPSVSVLYSW